MQSSSKQNKHMKNLRCSWSDVTHHQSFITQTTWYGAKKDEKLCGNFQQYYAKESDVYAEKMPDYVEISK